MDTDELLIVLLTGGGLALIGTVLGALITQVFAVRIGREARREERRLAVKTFQRDTLVALQDDLVQAMNLSDAAQRLREGPRDEFEAAKGAFKAAARGVEMHATRIRDEELRTAVSAWLRSSRDDFERTEGRRIYTAADIREAMVTTRTIYRRAGELIRTLDAIDEREGPTPRDEGASSLKSPASGTRSKS